MFMTTLVNGQYSTSTSVQDRGLAYGDGLFETIKVVNGRAIYLSTHLARLIKGCRRLNITCDIVAVKTDIVRLLSENTDQIQSAVLKLIITRESTGRSYQSSYHAGSNRIVSLMSALPANLRQNEGVAVMLCDTPLSINPILAGIKHLCRIENVLARAEWGTSFVAEGLLLDTQGRLVEGTMSNVFLVKGESLYTPSLHRCGVEGIIRQQIIARGCGFIRGDVFVRDLTLPDVYQSDEMFLCNSLIGIWPVTKIGCHHKKVGDVTRSLQRFLKADQHEF